MNTKFQKPSRSKKRAAGTHSRLFEEALKLFLEKSFENTTVSEITEAVDVAKGTFFTHFSTKEAVMAELGTLLLEQMEVTVRDLRQQGPAVETLILALFDAAGLWHEKNREPSGLIVQILTATPKGMAADRPNQLRFLDLRIDLVRHGQQKGELDSKVAAEIAARALAGVYFFTIMGWHFAPEKTSLRNMRAEGIGLVTKGLRA